MPVPAISASLLSPSRRVSPRSGRRRACAVSVEPRARACLATPASPPAVHAGPVRAVVGRCWGGVPGGNSTNKTKSAAHPTYGGIVCIDGQLEGEIQTGGTLVIGEEAVISANISAGTIIM